MFLHGNLNEALAALNIGTLPGTPSARPKSKIYTPKRDDENPRLFHMGVPPPPPGVALKSVNKILGFEHSNISYRSSVFCSQNNTQTCLKKKFSPFQHMPALSLLLSRNLVARLPIRFCGKIKINMTDHI